MKTEKCGLCDGRGYRVLVDGLFFDLVAICPKCQGMGKVEVQEAQ